MATRRRSKLEAKKPPPIAEIDKTPSADEHRPVSASSEDTGQCLTESTSCQNDIIFVEMEDADKKLATNSHPVVAISKDERLRNFLNVFVGLPVSKKFAWIFVAVQFTFSITPIFNVVTKNTEVIFRIVWHCC